MQAGLGRLQVAAQRREDFSLGDGRVDAGEVHLVSLKQRIEGLRAGVGFLAAAGEHAVHQCGGGCAGALFGAGNRVQRAVLRAARWQQTGLAILLGLPGAHQTGGQIAVAGEFTVAHQPGGPLALCGLHQFGGVSLRAYAVAADLHRFFKHVMAFVLSVGREWAAHTQGDAQQGAAQGGKA